MDVEEIKVLVAEGEQKEANPTKEINKEPTIEETHDEAVWVDSNDTESMLNMVESLDENESNRHEMYRRSHFDRAAIKECMTEAIQECYTHDKRIPSVTNLMTIAMAGMTKVFVGQIVAEARAIMEKRGEIGPITPFYLREAHRKYYKRHPLTRRRKIRRLFS
uniref:Uncharacterized protein AlNc14C72G4930 n=1 Tax=Albugo laibachii Nc14 TaxID=890382 RepID=F0WE74_9STRA|nr:conserved hypothetical protein [Albugo laibachii Nc14]|eukprot:CCA19503.1 conserved hypothetical protein [Albugo laibachii Nc14]